MMKKITLPWIFFTLFFGPLTLASSSAEDDLWWSSDYGGETVWGWDCGPRAVSFWVTSNGCTEKSSFKFAIYDDTHLPTIVLIRKTPDLCREKSFEKYIEFTYFEIGIDIPPSGKSCYSTFHVGNPRQFY